jgi:hypothetical protein
MLEGNCVCFQIIENVLIGGFIEITTNENRCILKIIHFSEFIDSLNQICDLIQSYFPKSVKTIESDPPPTTITTTEIQGKKNKTKQMSKS